MSKPWGGIGAWAAEAERAEAEELATAAAATSQAESLNFPTLKEAVNTKPKKKKMTLSEFTMSTSTGWGTEHPGLTPEEMLRLPTGPKERSAEEMQHGRLGGGFSSYGRSGHSMGRAGDRDDTDGSWGGNRRSWGGRFDEERRGPAARASDFNQPSRADEVDNWTLEKKSVSAFGSGRANRYGGGMGGLEGGVSRADEVDNWAKEKKPLPLRSSTLGSGFRTDSGDLDRWTRGASLEGDRERPRLVLDPPKANVDRHEPVKTSKPSPFGAARPREEILAEKGLDWKKIESELEAKRMSGPMSAQSSRPSSAQSTRSEGVENVVVKPRPKVNPFGDAKPREVLLEERGQDWRKIDLELEHRGVERPETEEEKLLKEEIDHLKKGLESTGSQSSFHDVIVKKERELEILIRELDDKVRFGKKAVERPVSGAGRTEGIPERPPSQSGSFDGSRGIVDMPRSRGMVDVWTRPANDRRPFQGGRDRGFLRNRNLERSSSRDQW